MVSKSSSKYVMLNADEDYESRLMHHRMGHNNIGTLRRMKNLNCAHGFKYLYEVDNRDNKCASYTQGKAKKESHHRRDKKKRGTLELVHSDLSGKITPASYN